MLTCFAHFLGPTSAKGRRTEGIKIGIGGIGTIAAAKIRGEIGIQDLHGKAVIGEVPSDLMKQVAMNCGLKAICSRKLALFMHI